MSARRSKGAARRAPRRKAGAARRAPRRKAGAPRRQGEDRSKRSQAAGAIASHWLELDGGVLASAALLVLLGAVMSYSATAPMALDQPLPPHFLRHITALLLGLCATAAAAAVPVRLWGRASLSFWAFSVALLVLTAITGVEVNGAQRWLELPGLPTRFQPAELAKFSTLLAVAAICAQRDGRREISSRRILAALALVIPPVALLIGQPDLGNAVVLSCLAGLVLIIAGAPVRKLVVPGLMLVLGTSAYVLLNPYAMRRVTGFLDPFRESQGSGFQLVQSFVAFGRGGLTGSGFGNGRQKLFYLPEAHTDFILAVVAEELGLIGVLAVLASFAALLVFGFRIASRAQDRFAVLAAFSMTTLLAVPAVINAAVVMGMLPTKGLTLPFFSYGRTSLLVCCIALGILLGIGRQYPAEDSSGLGRSRFRGKQWR